VPNRATVTPIAESPAFTDVHCFHCGLPVADAPAAPVLDVLGEQRRFCCHGCHAVCKAIVDAGLDDYYRHRSDPAVSANRQLVPDFLARVELFDRPEIQQDFVIRVGDCPGSGAAARQHPLSGLPVVE